jgi:hypothetical protein
MDVCTLGRFAMLARGSSVETVKSALAALLGQDGPIPGLILAFASYPKGFTMHRLRASWTDKKQEPDWHTVASNIRVEVILFLVNGQICEL